jgi:prolipoprotein diacylglyceryltransferase
MFLEQRHPTQIYLLIAALGIYLILRGQRDPAPGIPMLTFLFLHAVSRFTVEFFVESPLVAGPVTLAQIASAVVALLALVGLFVITRREQRAAPAMETGWGPDQPPGEPPPA